MRSLIPLSLVLTLLDVYPAGAVSFPFNIHVKTPSNHLERRANVSSQTTSNNSIPIANSHNAEYISNITLGGQTIAVMLDTGSSDLWVTGNNIQATDTGKSATLSYAVGQAKGNIHTATLQFDNYTVNDQAFLLVTDTSAFSTNIHVQGYDGLIGLGPNSGSVINGKLDGDTGNAVLSRIFEQNKTTQNFVSFLLDRSGDPGDPFTGQLTISELISGYENITNQEKLSVEMVAGLIDENQHWQILTDKNNGVIGPDGQVIDISSIVPKAPDGKLVAVIDSGFTLPQVPREMADAIYGRVQGAIYDTTQQLWTLPCGQLLNISFNFGGVNFPIHPLDTVNNDFSYTDGSGKPACIGAFQPITSAFSLLGTYDLILGMGFLRNSYTLLDYGNWVDVSSNDRSDPYVQLLPVTNVKDAVADFINVRLGGVDTSGDAQYALLPASQMKHSPISAEEKKKKYQEMVLSRWPYILVGCLVFVLLLFGLTVWRCCRRRVKKKRIASFVPGQGENGAYMSLEEQGGKRHNSPGYMDASSDAGHGYSSRTR
jgi:hypothetical protein